MNQSNQSRLPLLPAFHSKSTYGLWWDVLACNSELNNYPRQSANSSLRKRETALVIKDLSTALSIYSVAELPGSTLLPSGTLPGTPSDNRRLPNNRTG